MTESLSPSLGGGMTQFHRLLERLPLAAYACDSGGLITYYNRAAANLWGREPLNSDPADRYCGSFKLFSAETGLPIAPQDSWMARTLAKDQAFDPQRVIIERPDGTRVIALAHPSPVHDDAGQLIGAVNVLMDISNQPDVVEIQARLAAIVESSEDAIVSKTLDGIILSWNGGAERLFGYTAEEAIGQPITLIVPGDRVSEERHILDRLRHGERVDHIETVRIDKFGRRLDISLTISPIRDSTGRITGASKVARDITSRKQADASIVALKDELTQQLSDLRRLNEMSSRLTGTTELQPILDGILQTAVAVEGSDIGLLSLWNPERTHLTIGASLGFSAEFLKAIAVMDPGQGACGICIRDKTRVVIEDAQTDTRMNGFHGLLREAGIKSIHSTPLVTRAGDAIGVLTVHFRAPRIPSDRERHVADLCARQAVDFIENARLFEQLREADRRKDEFIATLAHELRNPLAPISNALHILGLTAKQSPAVEGVRQIMERQLKHLIRLVDDLLEVSRITRGKIELRKEIVPISFIVDSAVETSRPLMTDAGHQLNVSVPSESISVNADPVRIAQVISNLLNNAAKYTEEGGQIGLTVRREGDNVVVAVRDNGLGIAPEMLPRVFDMFLQVDRTRQRAHGGLGIGLTLAKRLIQMHDATIEASSAGIGQGSEFRIRLPTVKQIGNPPPADSKVRRDAALPVRRIVVVDDARAAAHVLSKLLEAMGQQVTSVNDAADAIELIERELPDIVISDIAMPGMDGHELARRLRGKESLKSVTLVALTGYGRDVDRENTREAGFDHHLVKPVSLEALQDLLHALPANPSSAAS